jgi:hypothetical protein
MSLTASVLGAELQDVVSVHMFAVAVTSECLVIPRTPVSSIVCVCLSSCLES